MKPLLNLSETNYIELGKIIGWEITWKQNRFCY